MTKKNTDWKWVLIADDDQDTRELMRDQIEAEFLEKLKIVEARDGIEASQKLTYQAFDLIITDLNMPKRDGAQFIEKVKESSLNQTTPIIVVSGFPDEDLETKHKSLVTIAKPYAKDEFIGAITRQFKLGRLDERVGAEVLNSIIESCTQFVEKILGTSVSVERPTIKKYDQELIGETVCYMDIKTGFGSCKVAIGFDNKVLQHLHQAVKNPNPFVADQLASTAMSVIFKLAIKVFQKHSDIVPTMTQSFVFGDKSSFEYKEVSNSKGIIIPLATDLGRIYAQAIHVEKRIRATKTA